MTTTSRLTDQPLDLDQIEARAQAATPGPWEVSDYYDDVIDVEGGHLASYWLEADGQFIAHAREDVAAMAAEIRRLRAELARRVQCNDCGAVGEVFTANDGRAYLDPTGQIWHEPAAVRP